MLRAMIETSARLLALLSLLQMRREWTGQELADRLEVGPRTIRRDVEKLRSLGYPVQAAPGVAGGYRLGAGAELPPLLLDDAEAVAVAVGLRVGASGPIAGIEEISVRALAKLEQVLPSHLRRRVNALSQMTSALTVDGPQIDTETLATLAAACRDAVRVHFSYVARDGESSMRAVDPSSVVYSGRRWYLVAFDLDRDAWRTFRLDRIDGALRLGARGKPRPVPGGDPASYVRDQLRRYATGADSDAEPGVIRVLASAGRIAGRVPGQFASVEPEGTAACIIRSSGAWSRHFLIWVALLDEPFEVLGPPELVATARRLADSLSAAVA
jgi:predicted DNA-binding transcriptional regulator YafY